MIPGARCRSCNAPIEWAWTENGKRIPLDPGTHDRGNLEPTDPDDPHPIVRYVTPGPGLRRSHFASCPNANRHRKPTSS